MKYKWIYLFISFFAASSAWGLESGNLNAVKKSGDTMTGSLSAPTITATTQFIGGDLTASSATVTYNIGAGSATFTNQVNIKWDSTSNHLQLWDSNVTHGMTDQLPNGVFAVLRQGYTNGGQLDLKGLTKNVSSTALTLSGISGQTTVAQPTVRIQGLKKSGTTWGPLADNEAVLEISNQGNNPITVLGSGHLITSSGVSITSATVKGAGLEVSTATTSTASMKIIGAVAALPTTGYGSGVLAVLTTDNALYISTETVSGAWSWIKVGAQ